MLYRNQVNDANRRDRRVHFPNGSSGNPLCKTIGLVTILSNHRELITCRRCRHLTSPVYSPAGSKTIEQLEMVLVSE